MEFSVAILLVDGKAGLEQFTDACVRRAKVQDMIIIKLVSALEREPSMAALTSALAT